MEEKDLLEEDKKIKDEVQESGAGEAQGDADTRTAENGSDEAAVEAQASESGEEPAEEDKEPDVVPVDEAGNEVPEGEPALEENPVDENPVDEMENPEPEEKMLTQSQVNELVGKARAEGRASAMKELYERYGVADDSELNDVFGRGQGYDLLNDEFNGLNTKWKEATAENALLKSKIVPTRWDDVKAILGSKGLEVTPDNIGAELATHPEWVEEGAPVVNENVNKEITPEMAEEMAKNAGQGKMPEQEPAVIKKLGSNIPKAEPKTEDEEAMRYFGL